MRRGAFSIGLPLLWAMGGIAVLAIAGLAPVLVSAILADASLHDTYYVVAHGEYAIKVAAMFGVFAGWYYLFPKVTGWSYSALLAKIHFWLLFIGVGASYVPLVLFLVYFRFGMADLPDAFRYANFLSIAEAFAVAAGIVVFFVNMGLAFWHRRPAR